VSHARQVEEPPVGFQICFYDARGLRSVPVQLSVHDASHPQVIRERLYEAWQSLCYGLQPNPPARLDVQRAVKAAMRAEMKERGPPDAA